MDKLWIVILIGYAVCVAESIFTLTNRRPVMRKVMWASLAVSFTAHTIWLLARGIEAKRYPLVGTEETSAYLSWCLVVSYLVASLWYNATALGSFIFPIILALSTIAAVTPESLIVPEGIDQPLQRILFPVHAGLILLAYSAFFIAFGAGVMYMIQERELRLKRFSAIFFRLPSLDTCDAISSKAMAIGFVLFTFGIAAGLGWQRARDGQYWHGDPIEIFSLFTWLIYLFLVQSRISVKWGGRTAALASIVSFMIVIFSLVGVRYLGNLHVFS